MKAFLVSFLAFCLATRTLSQDPHKIDSLNKLLLTTNIDTIKALTIGALGGEMVWTKPDSCLYYTELGLELINNGVIKAKLERSENFDLYAFEARMYVMRAVAFSELKTDLQEGNHLTNVLAVGISITSDWLERFNTQLSWGNFKQQPPIVLSSQ